MWLLTRRRFDRREAPPSATPTLEAVPIPLVAQPLRGQRDLPFLHQPQRVVGVPGGEVVSPTAAAAMREEGVDRAHGVARARRTPPGRRTARAGVRRGRELGVVQTEGRLGRAAPS